MKSQTTTRAALIAALSILAAIIGIALSMQHENGDVFVEIKPMPTPKATNMISSTPLPSPAALPSPTPEATLQPSCPSAATPAPVQGGKAFFTLSILNDTISVAYGVEESTLKKTPGWLTTSVLPGENGMCVVYGHRNRNHLKVICWNIRSTAVRKNGMGRRFLRCFFPDITPISRHGDVSSRSCEQQRDDRIFLKKQT